MLRLRLGFQQLAVLGHLGFQRLAVFGLPNTPSGHAILPGGFFSFRAFLGLSTVSNPPKQDLVPSLSLDVPSFLPD